MKEAKGANQKGERKEAGMCTIPVNREGKHILERENEYSNSIKGNSHSFLCFLLFTICSIAGWEVVGERPAALCVDVLLTCRILFVHRS